MGIDSESLDQMHLNCLSFPKVLVYVFLELKREELWDLRMCFTLRYIFFINY